MGGVHVFPFISVEAAHGSSSAWYLSFLLLDAIAQASLEAAVVAVSCGHLQGIIQSNFKENGNFKYRFGTRFFGHYHHTIVVVGEDWQQAEKRNVRQIQCVGKQPSTQYFRE